MGSGETLIPDQDLGWMVGCGRMGSNITVLLSPYTLTLEFPGSLEPQAAVRLWELQARETVLRALCPRAWSPRTTELRGFGFSRVHFLTLSSINLFVLVVPEGWTAATKNTSETRFHHRAQVQSRECRREGGKERSLSVLPSHSCAPCPGHQERGNLGRVWVCAVYPW